MSDLVRNLRRAWLDKDAGAASLLWDCLEEAGFPWVQSRYTSFPCFLLCGEDCDAYILQVWRYDNEQYWHWTIVNGEGLLAFPNNHPTAEMAKTAALAALRSLLTGNK